MVWFEFYICCSVCTFPKDAYSKMRIHLANGYTLSTHERYFSRTVFIFLAVCSTVFPLRGQFLVDFGGMSHSLGTTNKVQQAERKCIELYHWLEQTKSQNTSTDCWNERRNIFYTHSHISCTIHRCTGQQPKPKKKNTHTHMNWIEKNLTHLKILDAIRANTLFWWMISCIYFLDQAKTSYAFCWELFCFVLFLVFIQF